MYTYNFRADGRPNEAPRYRGLFVTLGFGEYFVAKEASVALEPGEPARGRLGVIQPHQLPAIGAFRPVALLLWLTHRELVSEIRHKRNIESSRYLYVKAGE